jgi:hypothetical protein
LKYTLLFFALCLNAIVFSQQLQETVNKIIQTAKNQVAENTLVYTFNSIGFSQSSSDSDIIEVQSLDTEINNILKKFLNTEGVLEGGYDKATGTFTIVTDVNTDLTQVVMAINKNEP